MATAEPARCNACTSMLTYSASASALVVPSEPTLAVPSGKGSAAASGLATSSGGGSSCGKMQPGVAARCTIQQRCGWRSSTLLNLPEAASSGGRLTAPPRSAMRMPEPAERKVSTSMCTYSAASVPPAGAAVSSAAAASVISAPSGNGSGAESEQTPIAGASGSSGSSIPGV
eukprot:6200848-Pleurochrysis_carterae.AAC.3